MSVIVIEKNLVDLIKTEINTEKALMLNDVAVYAFENSYQFVLCDSMACEPEEIPEKLRKRLIEHSLVNFKDSDLAFSDLTATIEYFFYEASAKLIEEFADNYLEDDAYDIEDNNLHIELMDMYSDSKNLCNFKFDKERDTLSLTTYNFLDLEVNIEFEISRMNEKEYICNLLISKLTEILR